MEVHYVNLHQFVCVCFSMQDDSGWAVDQTSYSGEPSSAVQDNVAHSNAAGNVRTVHAYTCRVHELIHGCLIPIQTPQEECGDGEQSEESSARQSRSGDTAASLRHDPKVSSFQSANRSWICEKPY